MARFGIQELADILVNKGGLSNDEAVSFVNAFFDLIQEGINIDEIVKVKGLGTFKLVNVEARESVNVNTGERVLIDSHVKVSFTPDATMKDIVNKPFSSFETVILNDGVTFDDMNPVVATESDIELDEAAEYETEVYTEAPETPEEETKVPTEEVVTPTEEIVTSGTVEETATEDTQQVEQQEETSTNVEDNSEMIEIAEDEEVELTPKDEKVELTSDDKEDKAGSNTTEDDVVSDDNNNSNDTSSWGIYVAFVVALLVGFIAGVCLSDDIKSLINGHKEDVLKEKFVVTVEERLNDSMIVVTTNDSVVIKKYSVIKDSVQTIKAEPQKAEPQKTEPQKTEPQKTEPQKTEAAKTDAVVPEPEYKKYEQMDSRVRYGAYYIMGTASVVKTKKDDTSDRLSRRYLGEGMACYIEVYNGITASSVLPEGQDIKIPKLEWKKNVNKKNKK